MQTIKLTCEKCGSSYEKPSVFKEYLILTKYNIFYRWSLTFCDKCRREKEQASLKVLPDILKNLEI
jgi:hypothetical protein